MTRLDGISDRDADAITRLVYRSAKKWLGTVTDPLRLMAHNKSVMLGVGFFELAWAKASSVDPVLKDLCQLKVAAMVGCLF